MRADVRRHPRQPVTETVLLQDNGRRFLCETVDLTEAGLRGRQACGLAPTNGAKIGIALPNGQVRTGVVRWAGRMEFGVAFTWPLSASCEKPRHGVQDLGDDALDLGHDAPGCAPDDLRTILRLQAASRTC